MTDKSEPSVFFKCSDYTVQESMDTDEGDALHVKPMDLYLHCLEGKDASCVPFHIFGI